MSASASSSAAPQSAPQGSAPRPVGPPVASPGSRRKWIVIALVVVAAAGAWFLRSRQEAKKPAVTAGIRTVKVVSGPLTRTVRLTGTTAAGNYANVTMPMLRGPDSGRNLTLIFLAKSGTIIKKGDKVAQVDGQALQDHIDDCEAQVTQSGMDIRKGEADQAIELETLRQTLRVAKANVDKNRLDVGASEVRTVIDQELLKLSAEETQAQYNELTKDFNTVLERQKSERKLREIAKDKLVRHRDHHISDLGRFTIYATMPGLVVMQSVWRGGDMGQMQLGDTVSPGQPFMKIVDPASIRLDAAINQAESESIRLGQPASVKFDAFPGLVLRGKVVAVGALAVGGWRASYYIRSVPVRIELLDQDPRVIPDLSAGADVVIGEDGDKLLVPREAIYQAGGKQVVYVKQAGSFVKREIQIGGLNNTHAGVSSGLKAGEEVALQPPAVLTASR